MTPQELAHERNLSKDREAKREAERPPHRPAPFGLQNTFGRNKKFDHEYLPPDDLNVSGRRQK